MHFLLGVLFFGEPMPGTRWLGFALIWVALAIFTVDSLRRHRAARQEVRTVTVGA
jgi:chloramphenicol-sensitive protein RarD